MANTCSLHYTFYLRWAKFSGMQTNFIRAWTTCWVGLSMGEILVQHGPSKNVYMTKFIHAEPMFLVRVPFYLSCGKFSAVSMGFQWPSLGWVWIFLWNHWHIINKSMFPEFYLCAPYTLLLQFCLKIARPDLCWSKTQWHAANIWLWKFIFRQWRLTRHRLFLWFLRTFFHLGK